MKPLIGIPCFQEQLPEEIRPRYTMYQTYVHALAAAGAAPVLIPLALDQEAHQSIFERLDGLVLAGGDDMNPVRYGQAVHPKTEIPDDVRDELEINLTRWATEQGKPLLAICRGVQVLAVALGGTLIQDIEEQVPGALPHTYPWNSPALRCKATHAISIASGSHLSTILGMRAAVNSFHHQGLDNVPDELTVVARAPDGIIEAVESTDHRVVWGVQWHPEDMFETDPSMLNLFKAFVETIKT